MKKAIVALSLVALGFGVIADSAEARRRGGGDRSRTIVQEAPASSGVDLSTLLLLGAMGGGGGAGVSSLIPLLALGGLGSSATETTIIEGGRDRGGRRGRRGPVSLRR